MRRHPVLGTFLILLGGLLLIGGAIGIGSPGPLAKLPLPAFVIVPFIFWQLAVWCVLFGVFFLRARGRVRTRQARFTF